MWKRSQNLTTKSRLRSSPSIVVFMPVLGLLGTTISGVFLINFVTYIKGALKAQKMTY